jgi:hypothetical protein
MTQNLGKTRSISIWNLKLRRIQFSKPILIDSLRISLALIDLIVNGKKEAVTQMIRKNTSVANEVMQSSWET